MCVYVQEETVSTKCNLSENVKYIDQSEQTEKIGLLIHILL